jgi:type VI secretion system protein ImpA
MSDLTIETLLKDVSTDAPCGINLEYDPAYLELIRIAQGTPERQMGATIIPAEEPNWRGVRDRCGELFARTKDLTIAVKLCEALLRVEGLDGLRNGLGVIRGLLDQRWENLHPQLDSKDGNDPTQRLTILSGLADPTQFVSRVRAVPLTDSVAGKFGLREIGWSRGQSAPPAGMEVPKAEVIDAAFRDTPPDALRATAQAADQAAEIVQAADARLTALVGTGQGINFEPLLKVLREVSSEVRRHLPQDPQATQGGAAGAGGAAVAAGASRSSTGDIQSLDDVRAAIERICKYYEQYEPSSPLPLLLRRAQRLVGKGFLDIMKDVSPDGVKQVESLAGIVEGA